MRDKEFWEFLYRDQDDNLTTFSFQSGDGITWGEVIDKFVAFVEQVYGYPIKDRIKIVENTTVDDEYDPFKPV